eukprot:jgi/Bigna1/135603/aug1.30_g10311
MGWVPETDRFHRITIVLRSSFVHTYRIESAGRVWQKDFEDAAWYSDTSTPTVNSITPGGMRKYVQTGGSHRVFLDSISGPVHPKTHFNPKMAEPQTCEGYVRFLYRTVLCRTGDSAGIAAHTGRCTSGAKTKAQIMDDFKASSE